jgi:hypothetical protein
MMVPKKMTTARLQFCYDYPRSLPRRFSPPPSLDKSHNQLW